jgi:putative hydrolase of the HAD superfamily
MADIHLICFDLGRVLVRICDSWKHAGEMARIPAPIERLPDDKRKAVHASVAALEVGQIDHAEFCDRVTPIFGLDRSHIESAWNVYPLGVFEGAVELVDELNSRNFATACLSNTNASHWGMMSDQSHPAYFPFERFTHAFASHLIGARKPDPAAYEHVETIAQVPGPRIAFFDDLPENIAAALQRGWNATLITRDEDPIAQARRALLRLGVLPD